MIDRTFFLAVWRLIKRTAIHHPPKIMLGVTGIFIFYVLLGRVRDKRWLGPILYALVVTSLFVFAAAFLFTLFARLP